MVANGFDENFEHATEPINKRHPFSSLHAKKKCLIDDATDEKFIEQNLNNAMSASAKEKKFQVRESLLTELFKTNHFSCLKNLYITFLILFVIESIASDLQLYGRY